MELQPLPLIGGPVGFAGTVSIESVDGGVQPWRCDIHDRDLLFPDVATRARMPAGVRVTLVSDTDSLAVDLAPSGLRGDAPLRVDLVVDGQFHARVELPLDGGRARFDHLPPGEHRLEAWLPQFGELRVTGVFIRPGATAAPLEDRRHRWLVYGSSITQCRQADGPTQTWPALVASKFNLNLTCMGFGGQCHLDPLIARTLRDQDAHVISLCLGINVYGAASLSPRSFPAAIIGLIRTIRDAHPRTPIACVSPIFGVQRETTPNAVGYTLEAMRRAICECVDKLAAAGDDKLIYVDGLALIGPGDAHVLPDQLHPHADGYRLLAERYAQHVMPPLLGALEGCPSCACV